MKHTYNARLRDSVPADCSIATDASFEKSQMKKTRAKMNATATRKIVTFLQSRG